MEVTRVETIDATEFSDKAVILTLSAPPTTEEQDALFSDESVVLEF